MCCVEEVVCREEAVVCREEEVVCREENVVCREDKWCAVRLVQARIRTRHLALCRYKIKQRRVTVFSALRELVDIVKKTLENGTRGVE